MDLAVKYFEDTLKVIPNPDSTLIVDSDEGCGELDIPSYIRSGGVADTDLHILVGAFYDATGDYAGTLAFAGPCYVGGDDI
jgi:Leishmanolysin